MVLDWRRVIWLIILLIDMSLGTKVRTNMYYVSDILTIAVAMKRMAASNVLIVGMKGLGVEIGKWLRGCMLLVSKDRHRPLFVR